MWESECKSDRERKTVKACVSVFTHPVSFLADALSPFLNFDTLAEGTVSESATILSKPVIKHD